MRLSDGGDVARGLGCEAAEEEYKPWRHETTCLHHHGHAVVSLAAREGDVRLFFLVFGDEGGGAGDGGGVDFDDPVQQVNNRLSDGHVAPDEAIDGTAT